MTLFRQRWRRILHPMPYAPAHNCDDNECHGNDQKWRLKDLSQLTPFHCESLRRQYACVGNGKTVGQNEGCAENRPNGGGQRIESLGKGQTAWRVLWVARTRRQR